MTTGFDTVKLSEIVEVWESYSGWYWFVTERHPDGLAFGLVRGFETEWGYFSLDEVMALAQQGKAWRVPKMNWPFCPCVIDDSGNGGGSPPTPAKDLKAGAS